MKKYFALLVGGLAMMVLASSANAALLECNPPAGTNAGQTSFGAPGYGTLTCSGFSVPTGWTLNSITIGIANDATSPVDLSSGVTWTWSYSSGLTTNPTIGGTSSVVAVQNGNGLAFDSCVSQAGTGNLNCSQNATVTSGWVLSNGTDGTLSAITFHVQSAATTGTGFSGNGVDTAGQANAHLYIGLNETSPAPEPVSLVMVGGGLVGLGLLSRKRRKA